MSKETKGSSKVQGLKDPSNGDIGDIESTVNTGSTVQWPSPFPQSSGGPGLQYDLSTAKAMKDTDSEQKHCQLETTIESGIRKSSTNTKRCRMSDSCHEDVEKEIDCSKEAQSIPATDSENDPGKDTNSDHNKEHDPKSISTVDTVIVPEPCTNEPSPVVVTLRIPRAVARLLASDADGTSALSQNLAESIRARAYNIMEANHGPTSSRPAETKVKDSDMDSHLQLEVKMDTGCSGETDTGPAACGSKRPINEVLDSDHSSIDIVTGTATTSRFEVESAASMPLTKHILLEELRMADEDWNQLPKQFEPLHGTRHADMIDDDVHHISLYMFTRTVKKYSRLDAFKHMPLTDQVTLMKANFHSATLVNTGISHHWRTRKILVDYPGCPEIDDDISNRFPSEVSKKLWRFGATYPDMCRGDKSLTLILCAMTVFDNDRDTIAKLTATSRGHVDETRRIYGQLLKEHLRTTYGEGSGHLAYLHLNSWLSLITMFASSGEYGASVDLDPNTFDILDTRISFDKKRRQP